MLARYFPPEYSGAALQALALARELRSRGHHVEFAVFGGTSGTGGPVDGFPVTRLRAGQGPKHQELRLWWNLYRLLRRRRHDFDILHSHGAYYTQAIVGPLGRLFGLKSVVKASLARNDLAGVDRTLAGHLHARMLRAVDACVAISSDLANELEAAGVARERIVRIPNGVDTERFRPAGAGEKVRAREALGLPPDRPVALFVGVFDRRKSILWLAEQWVATGGCGTGALLLAAGPVSRDREDRDVWQQARDLADRQPALLDVRRYLDNIQDLYRAADLLVLPSLAEGLPNVVMEAMASGLPCAVSAVAGNTDLVRDGETGRTFRPGDAEGLTAAVHGCLGEPGGRVAAAAREQILTRYSLASVADAYEPLYVRLLASGR
jgi:glycosyltransferase involved in cell wall biosynthesis